MNPTDIIVGAYNVYEAATSLEEAGQSAVQNIIGAAETSLVQGMQAATGIPFGAIQTAANGLGNIGKNLGVFSIGFLMIVGGLLWLAFAWGEDLVKVLDKIPIPAAE